MISPAEQGSAMGVLASTMSSGWHAATDDPGGAAVAAVAIVGTTVAMGWLLRRVSRRARSLRAQVILVAMASMATASLMAWLLADLMILEEDQLGTVLVVLALAIAIASTLIAFATAPLARAAHDLADSVERIEAGERTLPHPAPRADELGQVGVALEALARRLAELEAERAARDAERDHMLSSISHDLRSPLAALRAALEALVDGVSPDPDRYLRSMQADVDALTSLVDDFFLLARIEGGALDLELALVDLAECCDEAIEALAPIAESRSVAVRLDARHHVHARGNANALGRVVRNLIENAIRHAPRGSIIDVSVGADGQPRVSVVDQGPGFAEPFASHAFDRWSRADESRSRATGGAGLGLAIAHGLVDAHGGRIWIDPPPGGRVAFELPLLEHAD